MFSGAFPGLHLASFPQEVVLKLSSSTFTSSVLLSTYFFVGFSPLFERLSCLSRGPSASVLTSSFSFMGLMAKISPVFI